MSKKQILCGFCLSIFILAAQLLLVSDVMATCMVQCRAALRLQDCSEPANNKWPLNQKLRFSASCQTCCSPPGGPLKCENSPVNLSEFSILEDNTTNKITGNFTDLKTKCQDQEVFEFDGVLQAKTYNLLHTNMILIIFEVEQPVAESPDAEKVADDGMIGERMDESLTGELVSERTSDEKIVQEELASKEKPESLAENTGEASHEPIAPEMQREEIIAETSDEPPTADTVPSVDAGIPEGSSELIREHTAKEESKELTPTERVPEIAQDQTQTQGCGCNANLTLSMTGIILLLLSLFIIASKLRNRKS
jgi:hypothetical protein